ncbi:hypothetical protein B566_EDAN012960 [Ephemera danica]|nr:hypothetical protein B566_EDAN007526 [Ephemera danica]KAF4525553.1 hypothetical protein B566_EDAN012960 [Ephemera danica]
MLVPYLTQTHDALRFIAKVILKCDVTCVSGVGVYISRVEENSVAEHVGLRAGDSILEVNGMPFGGVSHDEALKVSVIFPISF